MLRHLFWFMQQLIRISWTCGTRNELCKFRQIYSTTRWHLNSFCSMVIGRSLSAFKIDELSTNFLICDHTSFNCGRSKFLAKLNDEDMIISKAVKPGEDINENDRTIFCCRHPFFKIYTLNLCTRSCRAGPATPSAKQ